ncbi:TPA: TlpA family protein disulfide reductase, partial [Candidatus Poribacteria bacterium]|nr:TlpA family protein disulfide reductase [Candidatus Poribacteria bacterium]
MVIGIYYPNPFRFRTLDEITQAANRLGFKFPVAIDVDGKILQKYWLDVNVRRRSSTSFLIDQKRKICYIHLGGGYHQGGSKSHQQCQQNYKELKTQINELL